MITKNDQISYAGREIFYQIIKFNKWASLKDFLVTWIRNCSALYIFKSDRIAIESNSDYSIGVT